MITISETVCQGKADELSGRKKELKKNKKKTTECSRKSNDTL